MSRRLRRHRPRSVRLPAGRRKLIIYQGWDGEKTAPSTTTKQQAGDLLGPPGDVIKLQVPGVLRAIGACSIGLELGNVVPHAPGVAQPVSPGIPGSAKGIAQIIGAERRWLAQHRELEVRDEAKAFGVHEQRWLHDYLGIVLEPGKDGRGRRRRLHDAAIADSNVALRVSAGDLEISCPRDAGITGCGSGR